jgi:ABC-type Fe3+-citrate transport system substrate-binding protein
MEKQQIVDELFTKNSELEKKIAKDEVLINDIQHKLYGIQSVLSSLMSSSYNEIINYDTFRSATGVALDSLDTVIANINDKL